MSVINTNITALIGQQNLVKSQNSLQTSMERLSSGLRINSAKDDAAGQAIANRMSAQITGLAQAQRNASDGISVAQTTEGALNQVNDNLQRIRELTVQAQNGTNSADDLQSIQNEIDQRLNEINRISEETSFNGVNVLASNQSLQIQVGANDGETIGIALSQINSETLQLENFDVTRGVVQTGSLGTGKTDGDTVPVATDVSAYTMVDGHATASNAVAIESGLYQDDNGDYFVKEDGGSDFFAVTIDTANDELDYNTESAATPSGTPVAVDDLTAVGVAVTLSTVPADTTLHEIQDSAGNGTGEYVIMGSDDNGNATYFSATVAADGSVTQGEALLADPLKALDDALSAVDAQRSDLGAIQNRFESAIKNLATTTTNLTAARSRIEDADYAVEVSNMTRAQILQQAGTSVLAQANQVPQSVLSLLG